MPQLILQFSAQDDFGSRLIRAFGHGLFSHVDIVMPDGQLLGARNDKIANIPAGVRIRPATYAQFSAMKQVAVQLTADQYLDAMNFLKEQIGKPYDRMSILSFAIDRNWRDDDAWFCSELAARTLEVARFFSYPLALAANKITPDDLLLVLSAVMKV